MKRTTTFLQGIGQALTPAPGRASREKREGMERLEAMMLRVLEEVEMLKRMKQGARRKTNGEMFKGDARSRLNPPDDAVIYIDEVRGDAANRERGESEEERMARIERSANDYEEEKTKRTMMSSAIATETNIIRQSSKEVRSAQQPMPEGSKAYQILGLPESDREEITNRRLTPLRIDQLETRQFTPVPVTTDDPPVIPPRPGAVPRNKTVEDVHSLSDESYAHGDEGLFNAAQRRPMAPSITDSSDSAERERVAARLSQVQDNSRKISIKDPIGLASPDDVITSGSARESGVLGEHLEGELGRRRSPSWIDRTERISAPPTPLSKDEQFKHRQIPAESPLPPVTQDFVEPGPSKPLQNGHQRQRSQYFFKDEHGRRQYYLGDPPNGGIDDAESQPPEKDSEFTEWRSKLQNYRNAVDPRKSKDKGKEKEVAEEASESSILNIQGVSAIQPYEPVQPLPSLFAATQHIQGSPSKKLKKKTFRKPITTAFGLRESPVSIPAWPRLGEDADLQGDELKLDSPGKKSRRSWKFGLGNSKPQPPQEPATLPRSSTGTGELVTISYPGPKQEVHGRNGFNYIHEPEEHDNDDIMSRETTQPQPSPRAYRGSMSDSVREDAMYTMQLGEELALGRHPASMEVPPGTQWTLHHQAQQARRQKHRDTAQQNQLDDTPTENAKEDLQIIPGPFAQRRINRDFTPTPPIREPLPAAHLIPDGLLPNTTYAPTAPLSPQKSEASAFSARSPSPPGEDSLYNATTIRQAFSSSLQRRPTPPRPSIPTTRTPRAPSNLAEQPRPKQPSTFKDQQAQLTNAELVATGQVSPSKTESSYKTAVDLEGSQERSNDGVRPPSLYSQNSIGGQVCLSIYHTNNLEILQEPCKNSTG